MERSASGAAGAIKERNIASVGKILIDQNVLKVHAIVRNVLCMYLLSGVNSHGELHLKKPSKNIGHYLLKINISIHKSYFVKPVLIDFYDHIMVTNVSLCTPYVNRQTVEWGRDQHSTFNPTHRDLIGYLWAGLICVNCD